MPQVGSHQPKGDSPGDVSEEPRDVGEAKEGLENELLRR